MKLTLLPLFLVFLLFFVCSNNTIAQSTQRNNSTTELDSIFFQQRLQRPRSTSNVPISHPQPMQNTKSSAKNYKPLRQVYSMSALANTCYDTSGRFFLRTDKHTYYAEKGVRTQDGKLLICGEYVTDTRLTGGGFLIKTDDKGVVYWAKLYDSIGNKSLYYIYYSHVIELKDGSIVVAGYTNNPVTDNTDIVLARLNANGEIIWHKTFKSRFWNNGTTGDNSYALQQLVQDQFSGDIFFTGSLWARGTTITRLDVNSGNILWSKTYHLYGQYIFDEPFGLDINEHKIISFNKWLFYGTTYWGIYEINKVTGDTLNTRFFIIDDSAADKLSIMLPDPLKKLSNGHYIVSGVTYAYSTYPWDDNIPLDQASVIEFDEQLDFVKAYSFKNNIKASPHYTSVTVFPDGSGVFALLHNVADYSSDFYYIQFKDGVIVKQRRKEYRAEGTPVTFDFIKLLDGGDLSVKLVWDSLNNRGNVEFLKLHISDTSSECLGKDDNSTFTRPFNMKLSQYSFDSISANVFMESRPKTIAVTTTSFDFLPGCEKVSYCDSLGLILPSDTICLSRPLTIIVRKNAACGAIPFFNYDTSYVKSFVQVDDSTYNVLFSRPWKGYIYASVSSCSTLRDSVHVTVMASQGKVNLGPDAELCSGNTILLNATSAYASYKWQDGKTDSTFLVSKPGEYQVIVTDACGNIYKDTILVKPHAPIVVDLGPDKTICKGDTATLIAAAAFSKYKWFPSYNIISDTSQIVKVYPNKDTMYKVRAELSPGCFGYDSVTVSVKNVPSINLGKDTTLCEGQSITFDAGSGFTYYQWSNGATTQQVNAQKTGAYWVKATSNGCSAKDTISILNIYPLPRFTLGNDTTLCDGQQLNYNFNFGQAVYAWSSGNNTPGETINAAGLYWLNVKQNGCSFSDSITVNYNPMPQVYLGRDTTLCEGATKLLNAAVANAVYSWQDGTQAPTYLVKKEGIYSVKATIGNCIASDSIYINYKQIPRFNFGEDLILCKGQELILNPQIRTSANYLWQDKSRNSSLKVVTDGTYSLLASNECGSFGDSIKITTVLCGINMPSAFTPNKDGLNDLFKVKYPFPVKLFNMRVYNRWGVKIFETNQMSKGWNGTYNDIDAPLGTYVWNITVTDLDGKKQSFTGTVTLLR